MLGRGFCNIQSRNVSNASKATIYYAYVPGANALFHLTLICNKLTISSWKMLEAAELCSDENREKNHTGGAILDQFLWRRKFTAVSGYNHHVHPLWIYIHYALYYYIIILNLQFPLLKFLPSSNSPL